MLCFTAVRIALHAIKWQALRSQLKSWCGQSSVFKTLVQVTHMPPELLTEGKMSKAADVYAMGVLLWELCAPHISCPLLTCVPQ